MCSSAGLFTRRVVQLAVYAQECAHHFGRTSAGGALRATYVRGTPRLHPEPAALERIARQRNAAP